MWIPYGFENTFFCIDRDDRAVVLKQGVEEHNTFKGAIRWL